MNEPPLHTWSTAVYDASRGKVVIYGGRPTSNYNITVDQTWELDPGNPAVAGTSTFAPAAPAAPACRVSRP